MSDSGVLLAMQNSFAWAGRVIYLRLYDGLLDISTMAAATQIRNSCSSIIIFRFVFAFNMDKSNKNTSDENYVAKELVLSLSHQVSFFSSPKKSAHQRGSFPSPRCRSLSPVQDKIVPDKTRKCSSLTKRSLTRDEVENSCPTPMTLVDSQWPPQQPQLCTLPPAQDSYALLKSKDTSDEPSQQPHSPAEPAKDSPCKEKLQLHSSPSEPSHGPPLLQYEKATVEQQVAKLQAEKATVELQVAMLHREKTIIEGRVAKLRVEEDAHFRDLLKFHEEKGALTWQKKYVELETTIIEREKLLSEQQKAELTERAMSLQKQEHELDQEKIAFLKGKEELKLSQAAFFKEKEEFKRTKEFIMAKFQEAKEETGTMEDFASSTPMEFKNITCWTNDAFRASNDNASEGDLGMSSVTEQYRGTLSCWTHDQLSNKHRLEKIVRESEGPDKIVFVLTQDSFIVKDGFIVVPDALKQTFERCKDEIPEIPDIRVDIKYYAWSESKTELVFKHYKSLLANARSLAMEGQMLHVVMTPRIAGMISYEKAAMLGDTYVMSSTLPVAFAATGGNEHQNDENLASADIVETRELKRKLKKKNMCKAIRCG
ncbi:hypothetical protein MPSEU_000736000 [Mayamaea pseudoterrestris]|nr:hypothetical protein MPSEU_000736000 [Mayamaea pseudoterrestris]